MNHRGWWAAPLAVLVLLVGCAHSGGTSDRDGGSTTTSNAGPTTVAPAIDYDPYAGTRPAVDPIGSVTTGTLRTADGLVRRYRLYVPAALPAGSPVPLLVALHGGTGWGEQFERNSGFDGLAESNRFIVVYPDGTNARADSTTLLTWNGGMCCGAAADRNVDDVGFIRALLDELERTQPIDPARVFASGHSNGAILAYRLACELSDRISAIGIQSGVIGVDCAPTRPVSVFHLHGLSDTNIPIDGGRGSGIAGVTFPSPRAAPIAFASFDRCTSGPSDASDPTNADVTARTWSTCAEGRMVRFVTVTGATHAWMGHPGAAAGGSTLVGIPYDGLDASRAIWSFLAAQPAR